MEAYVGQIQLFAFSRVPTGWQLCDGSLLSIAQNDVLYAVIGTTYGGDGINTFAVPDLRGRVPIHQGQGNGLSLHVLGERAGSEAVTLITTSMPAHPHGLQVAAADPPVGAAFTPSPTLDFATAVGGPLPYAASVAGGTVEPLAAATIAPAGNGLPHDNMMPTLVMNYCIALYGVYPTQS